MDTNKRTNPLERRNITKFRPVRIKLKDLRSFGFWEILLNVDVRLDFIHESAT